MCQTAGQEAIYTTTPAHGDQGRGWSEMWAGQFRLGTVVDRPATGPRVPSCHEVSHTPRSVVQGHHPQWPRMGQRMDFARSSTDPVSMRMPGPMVDDTDSFRM